MTETYIYEPINLCAIYDYVETPPTYLLEEWMQWWEKQDAFHGTVTMKIGNTWYIIKSCCDGTEQLSHKIKRLIFSDKGNFDGDR